MDTLFSAVILTCVALHTILFIYVQIRGNYVRTGRVWLSLAIPLAMLATIVFLLPAQGAQIAGKAGRPLGLALTLAATLITVGALIIADVRRTASQRSIRLWLGLGVIWLIALVATMLLSEQIVIGESDWIVRAVTAPNPFSWALIAGMSIASLVLLGTAFYAFYAAPLPEVANRALYWVIDIAAMLLGMTLMISGSDVLVMLGMVALLMGIGGAVYAQVSYRVFDIRSGMSLALKTALLVLLTALLVFGALQFITTMILNRATITATETNLLVAVAAFVVALLYVPLRRLTSAIINPLLKGRYINPTVATRRFSQQVSKAVELDQLIRACTDTLNDVLKVRRSGLLLVNDSGGEDGRVELLLMHGGAFTESRENNRKGLLSKQSPVYNQLAAGQAPLSQFDLDFSPKFRSTPADEREFISSLNMSAFAPVIVEDVLIGILVCGAKINDAPFYPRDLELLATLANQTGVALRNARLVADLRHLNNSMARLNKELEATNKQMERLDTVKSDFVTIASHELRTPLAQVRGYTDIIDALNDQGMLDQDQTRGMVNNLRKATERMEELISAMLDVSQLDVNAMDLRFAQTTPETVIRMAIEPLTDAIKQRKLTLSARGLRGLPPIGADMQRLVQAFRNIVVNAIKFTPDGGRIEITGSIHPAETADEREQILIAITDTGVGIAKENLELIFQKFFRAYDPGLHSTGTYKFMGAGPGLGLTIARGVIEGHGGKIWAESPGHNMETCPGTTFYVLLPISPPEDARRVLPFEG